MRPAVAIIVATTMTVLALTAAARSQQDASQPAKGAWRIETSKESESAASIALVTSAIDQDATFSLGCKADPKLFYLAIRDARLDLAAGSDARLSIRYPGEEPTYWQAAARGDGAVIVQEIVQQTAFTLMLDSLRQTAAPTVEFAVDDRRWTFRLEHFSAALQDLIAACGFAPDPHRRRSAPGADSDARRRGQPDLRDRPPRAR